MKLVTFEEIDRTTNRLAFSRMEMETAGGAVDKRRSQRHDLVFGDTVTISDAATMIEGARDGFVMFSSQFQLMTIFLFAKCNAGNGLFGGQKAVYISYIRGLHDQEWQIGTTFKNWPFAVTSIGNVYRSCGF